MRAECFQSIWHGVKQGDLYPRHADEIAEYLRKGGTFEMLGFTQCDFLVELSDILVKRGYSLQDRTWVIQDLKAQIKRAIIAQQRSSQIRFLSVAA